LLENADDHKFVDPIVYLVNLKFRWAPHKKTTALTEAVP